MTGAADRLAERLVGLAARILPAPVRDQHREEWLADLDGADEAGVAPASVAVGALVFSATVNRDTPGVSGMPVGALARRRARWGIVSITAGGVFGAGSYVVGGFARATRSTIASVEVALALIDTAILAVVIALLIVGVAQLWRAARVASPLAIITAAFATVGLACLVVATLEPEVFVPFAPLGLLAVVGAAVCGLIVWSSAPSVADLARPTVPLSNRRAALGILISTTALTALVAIGALDLLVWGPLAQTDGYSLAEIYAGLGEQDRANGIFMIAVWIVFWMLTVIAFAAFAWLLQWRGRALRSRGLFAVALLVASALLFFQGWAGFSLGMSIADTLLPYASGISPVGYVLMLLGQASFVGALLLGFAPRRYPRDTALWASIA